MTAKSGLLQLGQIDDYYQFCCTALTEFYSAIKDNRIAPPPKLFGASQIDLDNDKRLQLAELERQVVLTLLSTIEAWFRIDYEHRAKNKATDYLSMVFRKLYKRAGQKSSLKKEILKEWRNMISANKDAISIYKGALEYRNWLAHGRYWPIGQKYDYMDTYQLASTIETIIHVYS